MPSHNQAGKCCSLSCRGKTSTKPRVLCAGDLSNRRPVGAWSYAALGFLGLAMTGIWIVAVPISIAWLFNSLWFGRKQEGMAAADPRT